MPRPLNDLGLESGRVRVVPYSQRWPGLFAAERDRVSTFLTARGLTLELQHTGSTSVPGLSAKPIIDVLAGVHTESDRAIAIGALVAAGYDHRGEQDIPGRDFFRRGVPRQYHIHLTTVNSQFWADQTVFRDWLRTHAEAAAEYGRVKEELALRFPRDREAYIEGKTAFVHGVLRQARGHRRGAL